MGILKDIKLICGLCSEIGLLASGYLYFTGMEIKPYVVLFLGSFIGWLITNYLIMKKDEENEKRWRN